MYARLRLVAGGRDVEVVVHDPDATDADLAAALGRVSAAAAAPGARRRLADLGLRAGADVLPTPAPTATATGTGAAADVELAVVGGLDAGTRVAMRRRGPPIVVGRDDGADLVVDDLTVSRRHASVHVDPEGAVRWLDLGSRNGCRLLGDTVVGDKARWLSDGVLATGAEVQVGAARLALVDAVVDPAAGVDRQPPGLAGTVPHNRPPRRGLPPAPSPVTAPIAPPAPGPPMPLGVVAVVGPLLMAGAMVWLLGNPAFALLALLAPVMAVGHHVEGRRRQRTGGRREAARWRADIGRFGHELADAAAAELARRRAMAPHPAEVLRRAAVPSSRLWERRPGHDDWLHLGVGVGAAPWAPPVRDEVHGPRHPDVGAALAAAAVLPSGPIAVDLSGGGVVGVVGERRAALAVARWLLCQAAVHHGPADLPVLVACDHAAVADWDWAKWLPHVDDVRSDVRRLADGREAADALADEWLRPSAGEAEARPTLLVVVDGDALLTGRRAPLRRVLDGRGGPVAGIVVASRAERLPAACRSILVLPDDDGHVGRAELGVPALGLRLDVEPDGLGEAVARRCARDLAGLDDPELDHAGAGLPAVARLLPMLGLDPPSGDAVADRWASTGGGADLRCPLGVDAGGVVDLDLDRDGPHVLVAGTTGAGKSELLRSLVAGLAASADPDALTFLLIDFKGGSAFDACARLPHVVGLVTDLDATLAERALRCLDAELRHRERRLRARGAPDLVAYRRAGAGGAGGDEPLPRLVVVVDEFATLRAELPDFVDALVGVAQRGRSLGVHLVLATQRPAGAVSDHIKANTNLRIALRVQEPSESVDVVDVPDAAALHRSRPGRACIRFGPGEVATVQTALVTGRPDRASAPVEVHPFTFGPGPTSPSVAAGAEDAGPSDLDRLVDACVEAWAATGRPAPRRPWPDPLPDHLTLEAVAAFGAPASSVVPVGVVDDPDHQRQFVGGWRPSDGNLLVLGLVGSGTTTTLLALARGLAAEHPPDRLQLFAIDHGAGGLGPLARLPHLAAAVGAAELERQARLVGHLRAELDRRRTGDADVAEAPAVVLLLDGVGPFLAAFDDRAGMEVVDAFVRIVAEGPGVGIHAVLAADRVGALPSALAATVAQRWIHRLADPMDAGAAGVSSDVARLVPSLPAGRFVDRASGLLVQVAVPGDGWAAAFDTVAARWPAPRRVRAAAAVAIRTLPECVALDALRRRAELADRPWRVPVGLADRDLAPVALPIHQGDHVLVAGPGRAGRTMALATVVAAVRAARPDAVVAAVAGRRSWLGRSPLVEPAASVAAAVDAVLVGAERGAPSFLVVDDADAVDDDAGTIARLLGADHADVHVVAAGRAEVLRTQYAHWTRLVRRSRLGLLLHPHPDLDGDLLGTVLPRGRPLAPVPGRGYLVVDGVPALVQVAAVAGSDR